MGIVYALAGAALPHTLRYLIRFFTNRQPGTVKPIEFVSGCKRHGKAMTKLHDLCMFLISPGRDRDKSCAFEPLCITHSPAIERNGFKMKNSLHKNGFLVSAVVASFLSATMASTPMAFAKTAPLPPTPTQLPSKAGTPRATNYHVNPGTLRDQVLYGDTSVLTELNTVYQAKERLNIARGNLLPSLNISAVLSGSPTFLLGMVTFLLPFLLPSNWFNLKSSERQLAAEGYAFYVVELNEYASAYTAYQTVVRDLALQAVLQEQYDIAKRIETIVSQQVMVGEALRSDLLQASAQAQIARVQVSQVAELIRQEVAVIRKMMAFPLDQNIVIDSSAVAASHFEGQSNMSVAQYAYSRSPEREQVESLVRASQNDAWSAGFAFITGASLGGEVGSSGGIGKPQAGVSISLGFANYPAVKLNQVNVNYYRTRALDIQLELSRIVETALESINEVKTQVDLSSEAEKNYRVVLQARLQEYGLGQTDLLHVLDAQKDVSTASVTRVRAQLDLDTQRINLHRTTIGEQFAPIKDCNLKENNGGGWLQGLFSSPGSEMRTIDQLCRSMPAQTTAYN